MLITQRVEEQLSAKMESFERDILKKVLSTLDSAVDISLTRHLEARFIVMQSQERQYADLIDGVDIEDLGGEPGPYSRSGTPHGQQPSPATAGSNTTLAVTPVVPWADRDLEADEQRKRGRGRPPLDEVLVRELAEEFGDRAARVLSEHTNTPPPSQRLRAESPLQSSPDQPADAGNCATPMTDSDGGAKPE